MMEKIEVNGPNRHPIYAELTAVADAEGHDGDIRWNFEKFLVGKDGSITRFSPMVEPEDPRRRGDRGRTRLTATLRAPAETPNCVADGPAGS